MLCLRQCTATGVPVLLLHISAKQYPESLTTYINGSGTESCVHYRKKSHNGILWCPQPFLAQTKPQKKTVRWNLRGKPVEYSDGSALVLCLHCLREMVRARIHRRRRGSGDSSAFDYLGKKICSRAQPDFTQSRSSAKFPCSKVANFSAYFI